MAQETQPKQNEAGMDRRSRRRRSYRFVDRKRRLKKRLVQGALLCVTIYCAVRLVSYGLDGYRAQQSAAALRDAYYAEETQAPSPAATALPASVRPTAAVTEIPQPTAAAPVEADTDELPVQTYAENPYGIIADRFLSLRRRNSDIIGWLNIPDQLDTAVVQRDNSYYLNRDSLGYHNVNGAIFLEESCKLRPRPYTFILYGHNMKTEAMFGRLHAYESLSYYKEHAFLTFDTIYEEGSYVIVASGTINVNPSSWGYVSLYDLLSTSKARREKILNALLNRSVFQSQVDVTSEDQLLVLVTCVKDDTERRVVLARRIREEEATEELTRLVRLSTLK